MLTEMLNLLTVLGARASLLALAVFLIRKYWKKLPAGFGYFLSLLPFLRLMAPFFAPVDIPLGTVAENSFRGGLRGSRPPEACVFSGKRRWTQCLSGRTDISMPEDGQNIFCTACGRRGYAS